MSTENQKYSTENQALAIAAYAFERNIEIVRSYIDKARSGVTIAHRDALKELLDDVRCGRAGYSLILVYDVSRWDDSRTLMKAHTTNSSANRQALR
jgi:DNA invertase Pin-like site-specific DNA recombinase